MRDISNYYNSGSGVNDLPHTFLLTTPIFSHTKQHCFHEILLGASAPVALMVATPLKLYSYTCADGFIILYVSSLAYYLHGCLNIVLAVKEVNAAGAHSHSLRSCIYQYFMISYLIYKDYSLNCHSHTTQLLYQT